MVFLLFEESEHHYLVTGGCQQDQVNWRLVDYCLSHQRSLCHHELSIVECLILRNEVWSTAAIIY